MADYYILNSNIKIKNKKSKNFLIKLIEDEEHKENYSHDISNIWYDDNDFEKDEFEVQIQFETKYNYNKDNLKQFLKDFGDIEFTGYGFCYFNEFDEFEYSKEEGLKIFSFEGLEAYLKLYKNEEVEYLLTNKDFDNELLDEKKISKKSNLIKNFPNLINQFYEKLYIFKYNEKLMITPIDITKENIKEISDISIKYIDKKYLKDDTLEYFFEMLLEDRIYLTYYQENEDE